MTSQTPAAACCDTEPMRFQDSTYDDDESCRTSHKRLRCFINHIVDILRYTGSPRPSGQPSFPPPTFHALCWSGRKNAQCLNEEAARHDLIEFEAKSWKSGRFFPLSFLEVLSGDGDPVFTRIPAGISERSAAERRGKKKNHYLWSMITVSSLLLAMLYNLTIKWDIFETRHKQHLFWFAISHKAENIFMGRILYSADIIGILKMAVISIFLQTVVYKNPKFHAISMKISTV